MSATAAENLVIDESRVPPALAVLVAAALYATLPARYVSGSTAALSAARFVLPALEILVLIPLVLTAPRLWSRLNLLERLWRRRAILVVVGLISLANGASIILLVHFIITGHKLNGHELVRASINIWWTNVIVFGLWFWLLDGGGPMRRVATAGVRSGRDFLFPQQETPEIALPGWQPRFVDYLYISYTNAAAFSPTDTMPLTQWAKLLMLVESAASLLTLLMVAARAVNILT